MNKRGQVYILAALLISFIIFVLAAKQNIITRDPLKDDFEDLSKNYDTESTKFINLLTQTSYFGTNLDVKQIGQFFLDFTEDFSKYTRTQNKDYGLIYFFDMDTSDGRKLFIGNYLDQDIIAWVGNNNIQPESIDGCKNNVIGEVDFETFDLDTPIQVDQLSNCANYFNAPNEPTYNFYFIIGDIMYTSEISPGQTEIGILSQELKNKQKNLFIKGFQTGTLIDINDLCTGSAVPQNNIPDEVEQLPLPQTSLICNCDNRNNPNICELNSYCEWNEDLNICELED